MNRLRLDVILLGHDITMATKPLELVGPIAADLMIF